MKILCTPVRRVILVALLTGSVSALAQTVNPNGFPSGEHYNLNIIGKKADYNCTPLEYDQYGHPVYGNVIFVPETGQDIQIVIKSGKKGGSASTLYQQFRVTDACAPAFDGTPAVLELPPNANGYRVYARALAKPGGTATLTYGGSLFSAVDESGNNLVDLGLITSGGVGSTGETVTRAKGKSVAVDITKLFLWSGTVCTIDFTTPPTLTDPTGDGTYKPVCWTDDDGVAGFSSGDTLAPAVPDGLGGFTCAAGTGTLIWVKVICQTYVDTWIFNIADLVSSDWLLDNNGSKLIQVRFYPVP